MTLEEAQKQVDDWIKTVGVRYFNELTNTAILMEEVGELARLMARTYGEQSFKSSDQDRDLELRARVGRDNRASTLTDGQFDAAQEEFARN